jgi:hypothetical protein
MKFLTTATAALFCLTLTVSAQMHSGTQMQDYDKVFGVQSNARSYPFDVTLLDSQPAGNVLYPGDQPTFTFLVKNNGTEPITGSGKIDVMSYGTQGIPGDIWIPQVVKFADLPSIPIEVNIPAHGSQVIEAKPTLPQTFGGYALVMDLGPQGRRFATTCVRTFAQPAEEKIQFPKMALDATVGPVVLNRLGIHAVRFGISYIPSQDPHYDQKMAALAAAMREFSDNNITVLGTLDTTTGPQPLGQGRPHLSPDGVMQKTKADLASLPESDPDFQKFVSNLCQQYGWPKGPLTAVQLWNEPWDGISISGWGADIPRYRALYTAMAQGVEEARASGTDVLITGCDSSSNTLDKLFGDGKDTFLKWFDACTMHYQGLAAPSIYKMWLDKTGPNGRVKFWDTESWVANTDDRVGTVVAGDRAAGYDRAMGVFWGNVSSQNKARVTMPDGTLRQVDTYGVWSTAAAEGAASHFIGQRDFREILFKNGLPWVMIFDGSKDHPDDGTLVVTGDLRNAFQPDGLLFRGVEGMAEVREKDALLKQLNSLPADSPDRPALEKQLATPEGLSGGSLTLQNPAGEFVMYDFYGNPLAPTGKTIEVPLDTRGFYLGTTGAAGSFSRLIQAVTDARIEGYEPVQVVAHDLLAPVESKPSLHLTLTNVLNRPITGSLQVSLGDLTLDVPASVAIQAHESKDVVIPVTGGTPQPDNTYTLKVRFDAQQDGYAVHQEDLHVNFIAKRTIAVDGNLDDWKGVLPEPVHATIAGQGPSLMESAWLPFAKFDASQKSGFATGYLAYDANNFYFAAKIAEDSPLAETIRYAKRDDDSYYYPEKSYQYGPKTLLKKDEVWQQPSRTAAALLLPGSSTERSFTAWTSVDSAFAVDLDLPTSSLQQVSFYFVDWDDNKNGRRKTTVQVQDAASGKVLARTMVSEFGPGTYAKFLLSGKVRVVFTSNVGYLSASLSGIFFDPASAPSDGQPGDDATAKFLGLDLTTAGNWSATYGHDGYLVIGAAPHYPSYAQVTVPDVIDKTEHDWPAGVRRYSYRKSPDLPFGAKPAFDNVQIAFNVIPEDQKPAMIACPPGTMPGYVNYDDTDYEYALNPVAQDYGGGTEIWRCLVPGMVRKHFYPREPASPFDGPVSDGQLVVKQDGGYRIEEAAIPWSEIPLVKKALDAGGTIKFSYRVNAADGPSMELAEGRSVSKTNCYTFHPDYVSHWSNEVEFGFEK